MANEYSQLLYVYGAEFMVSAISYHFIFWKIFAYFHNIKVKKTPKECLLLSTNTISCIHSIIVTFSSIFDFFHFKRWQNPIIDEPKLAGHIWAIGCGYFFADLIAHLVCFVMYDKKTVPRRWDVIIHHILPIAVWFLTQFPKPIYGWYLFSLIFMCEMSTLFLNSQWFGKHFKNKKLEKLSQILFVITWFCIRVPITIYGIYWLINYFKRIKNDLPLQSVIGFYAGLLPLAALQVIWSIFIIWKVLYKAFSLSNKKNGPRPPSAFHGISVEIEDKW